MFSLPNRYRTHREKRNRIDKSGSSLRLHKSTGKYGVESGISEIRILLNFYAFKELNWDGKGINIDGEYLIRLRFADDVVIIADNPGDAQQMLTELQITSVQRNQTGQATHP